jgi:hypothetical protein
MATRKSQTNTMNGQSQKSTAMNTNSSLDNKTEIGFIPLFHKKLPVQIENDIPVKGTGLLIYQGWLKTVKYDKPCKAFIFAVRASDLTWKNIDITPTQYKPGTLYDRLLKAFNITNYYNPVIDDKETLEGFDEGLIFDEKHAIEQLETLRGLAYTAELERITNSKGYKQYNIILNTVKPILDQNGVHIRRQSIEETNPHAKTFFSLSEE